MCVEGAREVHSEAISRTPNDDLAVLVVWTPRYPGDTRAKAVDATKHVPDTRATHFWDEDGVVPKAYGRVLNLPAGKQFAWDTYMVFDATAEWTGSPPSPHDWMHQLSNVLGREHEQWLSGDVFRQTIQQLLD